MIDGKLLSDYSNLRRVFRHFLFHALSSYLLVDGFSLSFFNFNFTLSPLSHCKGILLMYIITVSGRNNSIYFLATGHKIDFTLSHWEDQRTAARSEEIYGDFLLQDRLVPM